MQYADGRTASNLPLVSRGRSEEARDLHDAAYSEDIAAPVLHSDSGSGGERSYDHTFWLSPVPPPGPLTFVTAWPLFGLEETHTVVDGAAIAEASGRAQVLWPSKPRHEATEEAPVPVLPATGWFADVARRQTGTPSQEL